MGYERILPIELFILKNEAKHKSKQDDQLPHY